MKILIVGLGTQGRKRIKSIGSNLVGTVDPISRDATYSQITDVPIAYYDAVFLCVPDDAKQELIAYCISNSKHILVEKPLVSNKSWNLTELEDRANSASIFMYTAYNHRFEPHFKSVKNVLESQELGKIFSIKMFYGNGTSQLVKSSNWRDTGMGVISDLAPHLLDTLAFWFGITKLKNLLIISHNFETKAPDHAVIHFSMEEVEVELEMSLCMWRNTFNCDIIGEKGSLHISSLCKWGPSILTQRKRVFPSGVPDELITRLEMPDPTWELEHEYFNSQIKKQSRTNLSTDFWIAESLSEMESML